VIQETTIAEIGCQTLLLTDALELT
jgi:hypothetical protein